MHIFLAVGECIILGNSMLYPHRVVECIVEEKTTVFSGIPSTFALLMIRVDLK